MRFPISFAKSFTHSSQRKNSPKEEIRSLTNSQKPYSKSKKLDEKCKIHYITSISFAHSKPIHLRKNNQEYFNLENARPKTSLDVNLYSNLDSERKHTANNKVTLFQNLTDIPSEDTIDPKIDPEIKDGAINTLEANFKTVDDSIKKDIIINNIAFMESDSYCDTIFGKVKERKEDSCSHLKTNSIASNKKLITLLPYTQSNSRRKFSNLKKIDFKNLINRNVNKNRNQQSLNINQKQAKDKIDKRICDNKSAIGNKTNVCQNEIIGKSYNNKSHIIFNEFLHISHSKSKSISKISSKKNSIF